MKTCNRCGIEKDNSEYYLDHRYQTPKSICKACTISAAQGRMEDPERKKKRRAYERDRHRKNPSIARNKSIRLYGIEPEDYDRMLDEQGGVCAICGTDKPTGVSNAHFVIDHDHNCCTSYPYCGNCVRGLLCNHCNIVLGQSRDRVSVLQSAIDYLNANAK